MSEDCPEFVKAWLNSENEEEAHARLKEIYENYSSYLIRFALRSMFMLRVRRDISLAQDIVQDVFVELIERRKSIKEGNFKAYVTKIAYGKVINFCKRSESKNFSLEQILETSPDISIESIMKVVPGSGSVFPVSQDNQYEQLYVEDLKGRFLKTLTPKEKEVIGLLLQGFDYKEIARILNISLDATRKRVQTLRGKIMGLLGDLRK